MLLDRRNPFSWEDSPVRFTLLVPAAALLLLAWHTSGGSAADDKTAVRVDKVEYKSWKNNIRLRNGDIELIATLDIGPRIISYRFADGKNVFKEYAKQMGKSGEKDWQIRGGHRLWVGPEDLTRTYALDNGPVRFAEVEPGLVRLIPRPDAEYGIQKEIDVKLPAHGSRVRVVHRLTNIGDKPARLAPWPISVMAPGGVEIIPLPGKTPHPGSAKNARTPEDFGPNQTMVLWPYFDFKDPRWTFGSRYLTLRQDKKRGPTKVGLAHRMGWVGYLNGGTLFVKRFGYEEGKHYPDRGCNFETFTNEDMLEIESLGPLVTLDPGAKVEAIEEWELSKDVPAFTDEAGIDKNVLPRVKGK
jgi:hypothetical protein